MLMKLLLVLCGFPLVLFAIPLRTALTKHKSFLSSLNNNNNNFHQKNNGNNNLDNKLTTITEASFLFTTRGGGFVEDSDDDDDDDDDDDMIASNDSTSLLILNKIRNLVRSLLDIGNKKSPTLTKAFTKLLKKIEKLTGVSLLPPKQEKKKKKKTKKKRSVSSSSSSKITSAKEDDEKYTPTPKKKKQQKTTTATKKHLSSTISSKNSNYRIQRELKDFITSPPPNLSVKVGSNIRIWIVSIVAADDSIYKGEVFKLRIQFPRDYPTVPPSVYFLEPTPQHEHVYTNGDICLSLLGKDWRPTMTAQSIAVSILSILSSAQHKQLPMDNARHAQNKPGQYQKDWVYHDDNC